MIHSDFVDGETLIDQNELRDLIPDIYLQSQLNELERDQIRKAFRWSRRSSKLRRELLSIEGVCLLHRQMFSNVWKWAGHFRKTEKNIGTVFWHQVPEEIKKLCDSIIALFQSIRFQMGMDAMPDLLQIFFCSSMSRNRCRGATRI